MQPGHMPPSPHAPVGPPGYASGYSQGYAQPSPYAQQPQAAFYGYPPMVQGEHVLVSTRNAVFPLVCPKCGNEATKQCKTAVNYINPWWYLTIAGGFVMFVIIALFVQKRATLYPNVCDACTERMKRLKFLPALGVIAFVASLGVAANGRHTWTVLVSVIFLVGAIISGGAASKLFKTKRVTADTVTLKGLHPNFTAILPPAP